MLPPPALWNTLQLHNREAAELPWAQDTLCFHTVALGHTSRKTAKKQKSALRTVSFSSSRSYERLSKCDTHELAFNETPRKIIFIDPACKICNLELIKEYVKWSRPDDLHSIVSNRAFVHNGRSEILIVDALQTIVARASAQLHQNTHCKPEKT